MKKITKKCLALVMSLVMLSSVIVPMTVSALSSQKPTEKATLSAYDIKNIVTSKKLTLNERYNVVFRGTDVYLKFVAPEDGSYIFESFSDDSDVDPVAYLFDYDSEYLEQNDDGGIGYNFCFCYTLEAGVTYYLRVSEYSGKRSTIPVMVRENNVESVSFDVEPITVVENCYGYWAEEWGWDEDTQEEYFVDEWFYYDIPSVQINSVTVTYNDGKGTVTYTWDNDETEFIDEDGNVLSGDIDYYDCQSYDDQWTVGTNVMTLKYLCAYFDVPVTVIKNPVDSISFSLAQPIIINEYDYIGIVGDRYYFYDIYEEGNTLTVNYNDGRGTVAYKYDDEEGAFVDAYGNAVEYMIEKYDDQDYENLWTVGTHYFTVGYCNATCEVPVTIEKSDEGNCSCPCHKSGIINIVWRFMNFLRKMFRLGESSYRFCDCGKDHWA